MADSATILTILANVVVAQAGKAIVDLTVQKNYEALKKLIEKRVKETQKDDQVVDLLLDKYEENPAVWRAPLEEELIRANVDQDQQIDKAVQELATLVTPKDAAYSRIASVAMVTRQQLQRIYDQGTDQAKQWSLFSLIAAIAGFLVIIGGVVAVLTINTTVGVITSVAGLIPEVAAALFFQQARDANKRIDSISDKLLEVDRINRAIEVVLTVEDASQDRLKETIVLKLLGLTDKK